MLINELLPNPIGKDTEGEWIELFNNSQGTVNLAGWQIKDASGKTFVFKNQIISAGEYLVLDYKTTKISLNNNTETLFLYDPKGNLIDKAGFTGVAPEGKSLARQNKQFIFTDQPTPGKVNIFKNSAASPGGSSQNQLTAVTVNNISPTPTNTQLQINLNHLIIGIILALVLALLFTIIFQKLSPE
jgi:hypothetical protein